MNNALPNDDKADNQTRARSPEQTDLALATVERTIRATYSQLEFCLDQAKRLVPVTEFSQLVHLLPQASIESQRFVLTELIKLDMLTAQQQGIFRDLDFYLAHCQELLGANDIPIDLVLTEQKIRIGAGISVSLADYQRRFPKWSEVLAEMPWGQGSSEAVAVVAGLPEFEVGQTVDDFRILRCLGKGAFAQVYLARQESMQRLVALKVSAQGSEEPQTLSQLDHPNIVRVYDQRSLPQWNLHLLYMQAILGGTLARVIKATAEKPLEGLTGRMLLESIDSALVEAQQQPPERGTEPLFAMTWAVVTAWIGSQLADGLQSAHERGVLHCDVKPANILMDASGRPKLVDFNVSDRGIDASHQRRIGGTLSYMSPEHLTTAINPQSGHWIDHRSDLYSLALVLWEFWQGQRPWAGGGSPETWRTAIDQQLDLRTKPLRCVRQDESPSGVWLQRLLRRCLDPKPANRPQTCRELGTSLRLALHPELVTRFSPPAGSLSATLVRWPVLLVTALIVFTTNGPAGAINYAYNREVIVRKYDQLLPHFQTISTLLNLIAFPMGGLLLVLFCLRVGRGLKRARTSLATDPAVVDFIWRFGHRAASISAGLWLTFGIIFPWVLQRYQPELSPADFLHFFLSLAVCGGIALIYPFFGISLLAACIYYPQLLLASMKDDQFEARSTWLKQKADFYLALAAIVPLLAILLLIMMRSQAPLAIQVLLVLVTLVNLFVSFQSHRLLHRVLDQYEPVLGNGPARERHRLGDS